MKGWMWLALLAGSPAAYADGGHPCFPERPLPHVEAIGEATGDAFREALAAEVREAHTTVVKWSVARKWMYAYYDDGTGLVRDVYGQTWLRGPALGMEEKLVNIEHTWPQSRFGGWEDRANLSEDEEKALRGDLHNLFPASEALNSARANKPFGEIPGCEPATSCSTDALFEPADAHKGDAARAIFYMALRYRLSVPDEMERVLRSWDAGDPPDDGERRRNDAIAAVQGNRNPFIDEPGLAARLSDF